VPAQHLSHHPLGGLGIASALCEHVKNVAMVFHCPTKSVVLTIDRDYHFIEMPLVPKGADSGPDLFGRMLTKSQRPLPQCFIGNFNVTDSQHLFKHTQAQRNGKRKYSHMAEPITSGGKR
jgi:hypothetical protein